MLVPQYIVCILLLTTRPMDDLGTSAKGVFISENAWSMSSSQSLAPMMSDWGIAVT